MIEEVSVATLAAKVAGFDEVPTESVATESIIDSGIYSREEEMKVLSVAKAVLYRACKMDGNMTNASLECQKSLRLEKQARMRHTTISDHFG